MEKLETIKDNFTKLNDKLGSITSLLDKMIDDYEKNPSILEDWENDEIVTDPLYVIEDTISSSCSSSCSFFITYLKPSNGYLKVIYEDIGDLLNINKCYEYLSSIFPKRQFTVKEVNKCYNILSILMERVNFIEDMDSHRLDCCFDHYLLNYGVFTQTRRSTLRDIYGSVKLMIPCYNLKHQENKSWKCCSKWTLDQKRDFDYPIFSIKELIS